MTQETPASIAKWIDETFGTSSTNMRCAERANEEMEELLDAVRLGLRKAPEECADVVIVLCGLCSRLGFDLWDEVNRKMAVNRGRKWALDGTGCGYHVKDGEAA